MDIRSQHLPATSLSVHLFIRLQRAVVTLSGSLVSLAVGCCALLWAGHTQAQLIDEIEINREGADAVVHVRFVSPIQFLRALPAKSNDQTLVFYRLLPSQLALNDVPSERRLPPGASGTQLPGITVTEESSAGRSATERRVLFRLTSPVKHIARAGRGNRTIDFVLEGLGPQLAPSQAAELPVDQAGRLRITLEASEQAGAFLSAPIPASLQNVNVFTSSRLVNGKRIFETHLGPFATRPEAEAALRAVRSRFPQAALTSNDQPATVAQAATPQVPTPAVVVAPLPAATPAAPAASAPATAPATPPAVPAPATQLAQAPAAAASAAAAPAAASAASAPAPTPVPTPVPTTASATPTPPSAQVTLPVPVDADLERQAAALLRTAREALLSGATQTAIDTFGRVLDLPPNRASREAQALIGDARLKAGDTGRARAEFDAFLRLYPTGADSDRVRATLAQLSQTGTTTTAGADGSRPKSTTTLTGSISSFYYGGQSKVRSQEFQESVIGGLPQLVSDATLSGTDQSQLVSSVDVNWRHRDAETEQRFVFRDTYSKDFDRPDKTRNKLTSLYYDQRSFTYGTSFRVGRQTPLGGGVLGRFDGVQAGYSFKPRWKASVVAGVPTDDLLATRRHFYGLSVDAEALTPKLGGSLFLIEQKIDGLVDRRAVGSDLRYFDGGVSVIGQLDYDVLLKGLNIASVQGTWQRADNTVFNLLLDQRKTPLLTLGNTLFFSGGTAQRITDLINAGATASDLRQQVRDTTAVSTQGAVGVTTPLTPQWQVGTDLRYTNTGAIAPVPVLLPQGQASSGDIWSFSAQLIGTNLYSSRDTHVVIANFISGPTFQGQLLSYNNSSLVGPGLQVEPSFKFYRQVSNDNVVSTRWSPGLRLTWRVRQEISLESEVSVENSKTTSPTRNESASRTFYYVGGRYDF